MHRFISRRLAPTCVAAAALALAGTAAAQPAPSAAAGKIKVGFMLPYPERRNRRFSRFLPILPPEMF